MITWVTFPYPNQINLRFIIFSTNCSLPKELNSKDDLVLGMEYSKKSSSASQVNHFEFDLFNKKFIFFPLQVEPERTSSYDVPFYSNQLEVIKHISKSMPVDCKLYVKEHYNMVFRGWRPIKFYQEIMSLPNVRLLHHSIAPDEIIKQCSLVITLTSTAGLDAAFENKPSIVFADVIYSELSSVKRIKHLEELPSLIHSQLNNKIEYSGLTDFVNLVKHNSFELDVFGLHSEVVAKFHNLGYVIRNNISLEELNSFLEHHKNKFELLALEYIKKIV